MRSQLPPFVRRILMIVLVPCIATMIGSDVSAQGSTADREAWLRDNSSVIRSIDSADEDFADLAPLAQAIGNATVVQLGESSHGAGATFQAKVRLIRFLHQTMGFDVVVWESGMFDLDQVNIALRAGGEPVAAARLGIFGIWAGTQQVDPLFAYAQSSVATSRPLEMAGFDMQFSGRGSAERFAGELQSFFGGLHDPQLRATSLAHVEAATTAYAAFTALQSARNERRREPRDAEGADSQTIRDGMEAWEAEHAASYRNRPPARDRFLEAVDALLQLLETRRAEFEMAHGTRRVEFSERIVGNYRRFGLTLYERDAADAPAEQSEQMRQTNNQWNRRDTRNADNLLWLIRDYYRGRKLIIWAHNGHIMNAYYSADWSSLSHEPQDGGMKPSGVFLQDELGDAVYTIGFTAHHGKHAQMGGGGTLSIEPAPKNSLEHALHQLGQPYLFVDFRRLDDRPDHWLRQPTTMAIRGYLPEELTDWTRVVDAMFFIDEMTPSTR